MVRSILAVIAGSVTWMVTALGMDTLLMSFAPQWFGPGGRVESVPVLLFMMCYALAFSVLGAYVAAAIARRREIAHAFALGLVQLALGVAATIKFWDTAPALYHIIFLALLVPANLLGGRLRQSQKEGAGGRRSVAAA
ncbi:MAG TPA: hypothetical protein VGV38_15620 [Pyrinomonadaceae bacterium]|nr:hypothetical protein [Pyrinomonadaceae bacterium]